MARVFILLCRRLMLAGLCESESSIDINACMTNRPTFFQAFTFSVLFQFSQYFAEYCLSVSRKRRFQFSFTFLRVFVRNVLCLLFYFNPDVIVNNYAFMKY